jgi:drug/metabolite transporter (DMT)-like permease
VTRPLLTTPTHSGRTWLPGFVALAAIWGSSFLFIKVGLGGLHPVYIALGRTAAGALTLLVLLAVLRQRLPRGWRVWAHLVFVGVVGVAVPFSLFGFAEQRIPSILAGIWNATTPLIALPMAVYAYRTEAMTMRRAVGLGVGFVGVLTILGVWHVDAGSSLVGQLMCFAAAVCYGISIPYTRRFLAKPDVPGTALAAGQLLTATAVLAMVAPFVAGGWPAASALTPGVIASVLALGAMGTGIAFALNFRVIRLAGASTSASVTYLIPVFSTLEGVFLLGEHVSWYQPVGALVVLLGVAVSQGALRWRPARPVVPVPAAGRGPRGVVSAASDCVG